MITMLIVSCVLVLLMLLSLIYRFYTLVRYNIGSKDYYQNLMFASLVDSTVMFTSFIVEITTPTYQRPWAAIFWLISSGSQLYFFYKNKANLEKINKG